MINSKNSKRALLLAVVSMILCLTVFVGTTFAWFTDTATSTGNRILAGDLQVELWMDKAQNGTYENISDQPNGDIFNIADNANDSHNTLWEPGKTQIVYLAVKNAANLDLKYNIVLDVKNVDTVAADLTNVLDWAIIDGAKAGDINLAGMSWESLIATAGVQSGDVSEGLILAAPNGTLLAEENGDNWEYFAIAVHMDKYADNQYKNDEVTIDVYVNATQLSSESDEFGNANYDTAA